MALFDKLKGIVKDVSQTATAVAKSAANDLSMLGNSPEAQAKREEAKQAEYARIREEMAAEKQAKKELMERIVNGDPEDERFRFLEDATDEEIAELEAMEAAKAVQDFLKRKQVRLDSGYAQKLLEENCACDQVPGAGFYCTTCKGQFYSNCGRGMLCERKQNHEDAGTYDELMFPDSMEYVARLSALEEGGPAAKKDRSDDVYAEFIEAYLPGFKNHLSSVYGSLGKKNYTLRFLMHLGQMPENVKVDHVKVFLAALGEPPAGEGAERVYFEKMAELLKMPSLYDQGDRGDISILDEEYDYSGYKELRYKVGVFSCVYNQDRLPEYYAYPSVVDPAELFTEDGAIKPSGYYTRTDDYDTIYGVLEYWKAKSEKMAAKNG